MSNIQHRYNHVTYDQVANVSLFGVVRTLATAPHPDLQHRMIPVMKESTVLSASGSLNEWYSQMEYELKLYRNGNTYRECEYLRIDIMFEFHCRQLLSEGVLVKRFGQHDDATLIQLYKDWLAKIVSMMEEAEKLCQEKSSEAKKIYTVTSTLKYFKTNLEPEQTIYYNGNDRFNIFKQFKLSVYNMLDFADIALFVSDSITDEEVCALYDKYPQYKTSNDTLHYRNGSEVPYDYSSYGYIKMYPQELTFVLRLDRDLVMETFKHEICGLVPCETTYNSITTHTTIDPKLTALHSYTFEQMIAEAEQLIKQKNLGKDAERGLAAMKELLHKDYVILRFNYILGLMQ